MNRWNSLVLVMAFTLAACGSGRSGVGASPSPAPVFETSAFVAEPPLTDTSDAWRATRQANQTQTAANNATAAANATQSASPEASPVFLTRPTQPANTPTPAQDICLDEAAEPRTFPPRTVPLEVRFNSDGNILVWEEESGLAEQISQTGDAGQFSFSRDGQVVAFERRTGNRDDEDYTDDYKVELWAIDRDGTNLRQLVSVEQFDAFIPEHGEAWVANFPSWFSWTPGTHRLTFGVFPMIDALGAAHSTQGVWHVDADSLELEPTQLPPLTEPGTDLFSPDGSQVAIVEPTGITLANTDGSNRRENVLTYPFNPQMEGGGFIAPDVRWTLDSQALLAITYPDFWNQEVFTTWRVPVDGSPAQELATFPGSPFSIYRSENLKYLAYYRVMRPASNDRELHIAFFDGSKDVVYASGELMEFWSWAPDGVHFIFGQDSTLAPQWGSVCGGFQPLFDPPVLPARQFAWVDSERILFVKGRHEDLTAELRLGWMGGETILIGLFNGETAHYQFDPDEAALGDSR